MSKYIYSTILAMFLFSMSLYAHNKNVNFSDDSKPVFVQEFLGQVDFVSGRLLQLENAFTDESFKWGAGKEVRTTAEIFMHVAGANKYFLFKANQEIQEDSMPEGMEGFEKSATGKAEVAAILSETFKDIKEKAATITEDDLNKNVKVFGMEMSMRNFMVTMLNHMHEHLGQAIAYARMNGVTPPWSKQEGN